MSQVLGVDNYGGQSASTNSSKLVSVASSSQAYVDYAVETANKVAKYQWDATNSGYYAIMVRDWTSAANNSKQLTFKYWAPAWFWLYDRTRNATYLNYAVNYLNTLVNKAWSNGFYDSYTNMWTPNTNVKSAAGNGITLWELSMAYARTGNKIYYAYANKTANWVIDNLWDSNKGCFWENTATIGTRTYVEGCSDVIIGLMSLYGMNNNQTYLGYISKSANFIISAWDSTYGGFYARVDATGSCATINNGCNKYPNENTWPIIALSHYYKISGDPNSKSYANKGVSYINSTLWDWNSAYNGGLFRSLYQNNAIRDNTKTAWDNCGEPWMIWDASENVGGNSTYQTLARRILGYCIGYLHDSVYGGFFTEVDRNGTTITFSTKDAESISDSIASLSLVGAVPVSATIPYLNLSVTLANKLHRYMLDTTSGAYFFSLSSNWIKVTTAQDTNHALLGNAFIIDGLVQLYTATGNSTYLLWASHTAEQFWKKGWDPVNGGFYDYYYSNWASTTCTQSLQNNAMFAVEFLNLYATNGSSVWLQRANSLVNLINNRFWDPSADVGEVSYDVCTRTLSGDVQIEVSVGSYLWAISQWTEATGSTAYVSRMESTASFAWSYLWDGPSNTLPGGPNSVGCTAGGYLGFMRSVYANLTGLEDCRKGANEDAWGAMGLAYLYNVTGNTVYKGYAEQALSWVNRTLWDPTYGGFHQDTFRNNTLRSACSSTNDARDYPGWTEGEQPWLFWSIGHLLGVQAYDRGALVSEQWTATHQWNSTANNGGDMTCLNSNTQPDKGNSWIYDWIQGSALHTYSTLTTTAAPAVVQPLTVTILETGAPAGTYTVNGCSPSPTTGTTGSTTSFTMPASCPFTISFTNTGGTRWGFIASGTFSATSSSHSSCSSGTCPTISFNVDYQLQLTVSGGNSVSYSLASETSDGWYKYGDSLKVSTNSIWNRANGIGTRLASWNLDDGTNTNVAQTTTFTKSSIAMAAAHTVNFNSVTQHQITVSAGTGGTASVATPPTIPGDTGWYDSGTNVQVSAAPNTGYAFSAWTGTGSGSYSGPSNPAAVILNAAITETASFTASSLALDGSANHYVANTASITVTLSTSKSPDVIIVLATIDSASLHVTGVSSTHLTFTLRMSSIADANHYISEWYAIASSPLSSEVITIANSGTDNMNVEAFGISGANTASPFDLSSASVSYSSTGSTTPAARISTSNANDFIFGLLSSQYVSSQTITKGSAYALILSDATDHPNIGSEYEVVSATQSGLSVNWALGKSQTWAVIADAVSQASGAVTVSQPITTSILESGAPTGETYTVNGCSPSPATGTVGGTTTFTMTASCSFTISFTNTGGTRVGFVLGGSFSAASSSQSTCASGTCTAATFKMDYQTQLTVNGGNGVTMSFASETSDIWYKYGDSLTVSTNSIWNRASGTGTRLSSWNLDGGSNTNVVLLTTYTTSAITMTAAHTVNFNSVTQYQISVIAGTGGTASATTSPTISGDTGWYDVNTIVSFSATPNSGYTFSAWTGTGTGSYSGTNNPASVTLTAYVTEAASFAGTASLSLDGTTTNQGSSTITLTTSKAPDVIIVVQSYYCKTTYCTVKSISGDGLTWHLRGQKQLLSGTNYLDVETWYAVTGSTVSGTITITRGSSGSVQHSEEMAFGVNGAGSCGTSCFDTNSGLPAYSSSSSAWTPTVSVSTSNAKDFVFAVQSEFSTGIESAGSCCTIITHDAGSGSINIGGQYVVKTAIQSGLALTFSSFEGGSGGIVIGDAIDPPSSGASPPTAGWSLSASHSMAGVAWVLAGLAFSCRFSRPIGRKPETD